MDFGFSKAASAILVIRSVRTPGFYRTKDNDNNSNKQTRKKKSTRFKEAGEGSEGVTLASHLGLLNLCAIV